MSNISAPFSLTAGQALKSDGGKASLSINAAGRAEIRLTGDNTLVWVSGGDSGARLDLQTDGNLVLYRKDGSSTWATGTSGGLRYDSFSMSLSDDGFLTVSGTSWWGSDQLWRNTAIADVSRQMHEQGTLPGGGNLVVGDYMRSANKQYTLTLADKGGIIITDASGRQTWTAGVNATGVSSLAMQTDKNLVLYDSKGNAVWSANIPRPGVSGQEKCVLGDDGDLSASNWGGIMWSAGSAQGPGRLSAGSSMSPGATLASPSGKYVLTLQKGGNLVLQDSDGKQVWMSGVAVPDVASLNMQRDGNLVLATTGGRVVWASNTACSSTLEHDGMGLQVNDDGTLSLLNAHRGTVWNSGKPSPDRLNSLQGMLPGSLVADGRKFTLAANGNLSVTNARNQTLWSSNTSTSSLAGLHVSNDGVLALTDTSGKVLWSLGGAGWYNAGKAAVFNGRRLSIADSKIVFGNNMVEGERLVFGDSLPSPSGQFELAFASDGQLVLQRVKDKVVLTGNGVSPGSSDTWLAVQADGNTVVYTGSSSSPKAVWSTSTYRGGNGQYLLQVTDFPMAVLSTDGGNKAVLWRMKPQKLLDGCTFAIGDSLESPSGTYSLTLMGGGILAMVRNSDKGILWQSTPGATSGAILRLQDDGNMVIYDSGNKAVWSSGSYTSGQRNYQLTVTDEGKAVYAQVGGKTVWTR